MIAVGKFRHVVSGAAVFGLALLYSGQSLADGAANTGYFGGVAIKGYDPVAYFTEAKAVKGSEEFQHEFLGETWQFSSSKNRDLFAGNPIQYAPQYGGFCAAEVHFSDNTTGISANINPEAWRIIDDKLYLFYDQGIAAVFEENAEAMVAKADSMWPKVQENLARK